MAEHFKHPDRGADGSPRSGEGGSPRAPKRPRLHPVYPGDPLRSPLVRVRFPSIRRDCTVRKPRGVSWPNSGSSRLEMIKQFPRRCGNVLHGSIECLLVGVRGNPIAVHFPHELQRRKPKLFIAGNPIRITQFLDVPAHFVPPPLSGFQFRLFRAIVPARIWRRFGVPSPRSRHWLRLVRVTGTRYNHVKRFMYFSVR